jgi:cytochrome c553
MLAAAVLRQMARTQRGRYFRCDAKHKEDAELYIKKEDAIMKTNKLIMLIGSIAVALFMLIPNLSWTADDGTSIYKAKCAACHGADAAGKPAANFPSLVSDGMKKSSDDDLAKTVAGKTKHPPVIKSLPPDQLKMVVNYMRSLQK